MADYVTITDAQVDPEAPITSELMSALRDNPTAIAEGASGAPRLTYTAIAEGLADVQERDIGSYTTAFYAVSLTLGLNNGASIAVGTEVAGSSLRVATSTTSTNTTYYVSPFETLSAGTNGFPTSNTTTLSGTWRLMTSGSYGRYTNDDPATYVWYPHLWLRIS